MRRKMKTIIKKTSVDNIDMDTINQAGEIIKTGWSGCISYGDCVWSWRGCVESAGFYENLCGERKTFG